LKLVSFIRFL